ncbi:Cof-type HAD-IIB family hydrolase [Bacillus sp. FSL W7-1360]
MSVRHLIALDLDGTLLPRNQQISPRTKRVLQEARDEGHVIVIATGRPYRASSKYYHELALTTPIVNFNGAEVHHPSNPQYPRTTASVSLETTHHLLEICDTIGVENVMVEMSNEFYVARNHGFFIEHLPGYTEPAGVGSLRSLVQAPPTTMMIQLEKTHVPRIQVALNELGESDILHRWWTGDTHVLEVAPKHVSKASGLSTIAEEYGVEQARVIAFGDQVNDMEMIDYAGHGVAMGNAIDSLKEIATAVTKTNEEDGIAHYLEKIL